MSDWHYCDEYADVPDDWGWTEWDRPTTDIPRWELEALMRYHWKNMEKSPPIQRECPICSAAIISRHCKLVCENCGYMEDCSDL